METRLLGSTDMQITPIGFGAWAIGGGGWQGGWGPQDDQESVDTIHAALDAGVNWVDTAAVYGFGHSEEVVGRALKERGEKPYVFTKCGLLPNPREPGRVINKIKADSIRREVDDSLRRLGVDVIDLYQIHWPDPDP
nr:aldo/keto reductase [Chloroflexaceae bacterium]